MPTAAVRLRLTSVALSALAAALLTTSPASALRLAGQALGVHGEIEVRDLPDADAETAIAAAFAEFDRSEARLAALAAAATNGATVTLEPDLASLVERTLGFCLWSENGIGPLGGELFRLFGLREPVRALPTPEATDAAVASAQCSNATFDRARSTLTLAARSRLDFFPFELGWAIDRAAETLSARGAANFEIVLGPLRRAKGKGATGLGWRVTLPASPGFAEPLSPFWLRDRSFAHLTPAVRTLVIAGDRLLPYVDHRTGRTAPGTLEVQVVSELATDAAGVAYAMFALGPRDGMMLLGSLQPHPSVRWILGSGEGEPVITDHNWGAVPRH